MLKYSFCEIFKFKNLNIDNIFIQKILLQELFLKFYIRGFVLGNKGNLLLDTNYKYFLINKNNLKNFYKILLNKVLVGQEINLNVFNYKNVNNLGFNYIAYNNFKNVFFQPYTRNIYINKKYLVSSLKIPFPLLFAKFKSFMVLKNGILYKFNKKHLLFLKKFFKKYKLILSLSQKYLYLIKKNYKLYIRAILLKFHKVFYNVKVKILRKYKN